ncbi:class I SAM-dependent methyltransferase, partial [Anaerolineae bacterium CFX8]|nr:class I SAM-dependent methyltransferase [Anaerolineae bacterium CFX8]
MTETLPPQPPVSPTAQTSPDALGLGQTSGQRGAEILAGFRAEKYPAPDTLALSRWSGRITARLLMRLTSSDAPMNFRALAKDESNPVIVEIAAGLSPRGLRLAQELPQAQVIEIDLPDVVRDKQQRLERAKDVTIPPNIQWLTADLGTTPLSKVLDGRQVDVVAAEGLLPYFSHQEITAMTRGVLSSLKPGGKFIADIPRQAGMEEIRQIMGFFSRQAGQLKGTVQTEDQARQLLLDAGYPSVS